MSELKRLREAIRANDEFNGNVSQEHYDILVAAARCVADAGEFDDAVADVIEDALSEDVILHYVGWAQRVLTALHTAGFEVIPQMRQERNEQI